jgi:hypothetical protein
VLDQDILEFAEFHRRVKCGEDSRTLIAKAIPLQKWFTSSRNERVRHVFIEAIFDGEVINKHTNADLYIVKVQNQAHERLQSPKSVRCFKFLTLIMATSLWLVAVTQSSQVAFDVLIQQSGARTSAGTE